MAEPITIRANIKRTAANHETGERTTLLTSPASESESHSKLAERDLTEYYVTFIPVEVVEGS